MSAIHKASEQIIQEWVTKMKLALVSPELTKKTS